MKSRPSGRAGIDHASAGGLWWLRFGNLNNGLTNAGLSCGNGNNGLGNANWNIGGRIFEKLNDTH